MSELLDMIDSDDEKKLFGLEPLSVGDPGDESFDSCDDDEVPPSISGVEDDEEEEDEGGS